MIPPRYFKCVDCRYEGFMPHSCNYPGQITLYLDTVLDEINRKLDLILNELEKKNEKMD